MKMKMFVKQNTKNAKYRPVPKADNVAFQSGADGNEK